MKHFFPVLLLGLATLAGCSKAEREVVIKDVRKAEIITLKKRPEQKSIHGIYIAGSGLLGGKAAVQLLFERQIYKEQHLSGGASFEIRSDWYSDDAEIRYIPQEVKEGRLELKYDFLD